ncbi:MAG: hypothetical protein A2045_10215 [Rhodocyclales bacterium GWA2_65_20]|nr:MAG: hypothetical protein A2045_10215 [Rhodocyclales bacterium GWA2_65_20]
MNTLLALFAEGRYAEVESLALALTEHFPLHGFGWKALGVALKQMGRIADALTPMQKAAALSPSDAEAHSNLGNALMDLGRLDEAEASCRRALQIKPDYAEAHSNLGNTLRELGRLDAAEASCRRALQIKPDFAEAYNNLGATLQELSRLDEAVASYRQAIQIKPDFAEAYNNLGATLQQLSGPDEAEASCRRALQIKPDYAEALTNLAVLLNAQGKSIVALRTINQSLQIKETGHSKSVFVACVKHLRFTHDDCENRIAMVRALTESWGRPRDLARVGIGLVKLSPDIAECVARAALAWPRRLSAQDLFGANGISSLTTLVSAPLLHALLNSVPICDTEMERFLTMARWALLEAVTEMSVKDRGVGADLDFLCALARQCFINEYVFSLTDIEFQKASDLRDSLVGALEARTQVPVLWPVVVAAYFPLYSVPLATLLLNTQWPEEVASLLVQQIREPEEERQLRVSIPRLTDIEDAVSLLVQSQYEENPYPRWVKVASNDNPLAVGVVLRRLFPLVPFQKLDANDSPDILIAGCGTGQHSIDTAQRFRGARVLAVDLSVSSLCYAVRKTRELDLTSIEYAQADLLKLASLGRSFDVIESAGVLHHLADPWAGWRILLSLLRPGGFMKIGLYSELARRNIARVRTLISERNYGSSAEDIRRCRQDLLSLDKSSDFESAVGCSDFFSISECRDLLFHVQEHRMTLTGIEEFLRDNHLAFLGFEVDPHVLIAYKQRFPNDCVATNLGQWQIFENENADTFSGMYQFWIQKTGHFTLQ